MVLEVVYKIDTPEVLADNGRYMGIDIGVDNLAAIASNTGLQPVIINGKGLKSVNKYYNKGKSHYQEAAQRRNKQDCSNRMNQLTIKRNCRVDDTMHKASKYIVDLAIENNINSIVINAFNLDFKDYEDALQSQCAEKVSIDFIVTRNAKDFSGSTIKTLTIEAFLAKVKADWI